MAEAATAPLRERRRAEILAVAGRLFAERGVRETTVRRIAGEVGVLAGSLYYYFHNKQGILHALMRPYVEDLLARYRRCAQTQGDARARLEALVRTSLEAMIAHPHENAVLQVELGRLFRAKEFAYLREAVDEIEAIYVAVIRSGVASGELRGDVEPRFLFRMMMDIVKGTAYWFDPAEHRVADLTAGWWKVLGGGLFAPAGSATVPPPLPEPC
jgi:AcrR family transcriptional regulator